MGFSHQIALHVAANIVAITWMHTGCESSRKFLEAQVISSSLDGWKVGWCPARWGGWSSALITLSSAVLSFSLTTPTFPLSPCCLYIGMSLVRRRRQPAVYASEQVCIGWHGTAACYTDKLTSHHSRWWSQEMIPALTVISCNCYQL